MIFLVRNIKIVLLLVSLLVIINRSNSQDLSNGTIDFIFEPENSWTQFVIWMEDGGGEYIATVYLTNFIGRNGGGNRISNPDIDLSNGNRLSALPIWAHKRNVIDTTFGMENNYPPSENKLSYPADIDAVSGATPSTSMQVKTWQLSNLPYGIYNIWIEANRSYDQNISHDYSFYRGQPSVAWNLPINVSNNPDSSEIPDYAGYGSPDGSDGNIRIADATITTAANLLDNMEGFRFKAVYSPGSVSIKCNPENIKSVHDFALKQNYPNPFNPKTIIEYTLRAHRDVPVHVGLSIYDIQGQKIATLVSRTQLAGNHRVEWDASGMASGVYVYTLQIGWPYEKSNPIFSETKKMLLIQ